MAFSDILSEPTTEIARSLVRRHFPHRVYRGVRNVINVSLSSLCYDLQLYSRISLSHYSYRGEFCSRNRDVSSRFTADRTHCLVTPPAQRVQFILGEEVGDDAHESHPLFSEMEELVRDGDEMEWKETAR